MAMMSIIRLRLPLVDHRADQPTLAATTKWDIRGHVYGSGKLRTLAIELDAGLDLVVLEKYERICLIAVGVVVRKSLQSLSVLALVEEPPGRLGSKEHKNELEDGGKTLKDGRDPP